MNEIAWQEWSKESFEKARASGKPILLDITGSWCHWCHVMDETSYSDPVIISTINKSFIPIRVDTDRRPDVNRRYNLGGWPTTAFLDSDGKIITGGTYIPPRQLREVLSSVLEFYSTNKSKMASKLRQSRPLEPKNEPLSDKITRDIATSIAVNFDIDYGGFGFEPKFPHAEALDYALIRYRFHGEKEMLTVVTKTLDRMGSGGIYDQVAGGFFRYSTTRDWSIPHFEKMAEDNAKLLAVYLHAYQVTNKSSYREKAENIVKFIQTTLSDTENGGFYGSQDADEEYYKLDLKARNIRKPPKVDKTLYTNYNAMLVSSFLQASPILDKSEIGRFAIKTLNRILDLIEGNSPFHYWKQSGGPVLNGLLIDYASLLQSMLDAYEFSARHVFLEHAVMIAEQGIEKLHEKSLGGGFYDIPPSDSNLGELRTRDRPIDENSLMAHGLQRLAWLSGDKKYEEICAKTLELFDADYERYGLAAAPYALALDAFINGPVGITIVAPPATKDFEALKGKALSLYSARRYISYLDPAKDFERIRSLGYDAKLAPVAYVCVGNACGPPVHDPSKMEVSLNSLVELKPPTG